jgi:hypothetical protein
MSPERQDQFFPGTLRRESVVLNRLAVRSSLALLVLALLVADRQAVGASIEAIHGKTYTLNGKHGPWMIMVTSLWGSTSEQEQQAARAADELVYQLRKKGVPAYVYKQDDQIEELESVDRAGRPRKTKVATQDGMIAVLAGNYHNADDKVAKETLKFVKKFNPKINVEWQGKQMDVPLVLTNAFMTRNPLLSPEELAKKHRDPLIVKLNSNIDHSLFENKGKYTLIVASFYGKSRVKPTQFKAFDNMLKMDAKKENISLDEAGRESWILMTLLRQQGYDAYVYHERYRSIVTVGAFKSPRDPQIADLTFKFKAKEKLNPETKQTALVAEAINIPGKKKGDPPVMLMMDPYPQLMDVPR